MRSSAIYAAALSALVSSNAFGSTVTVTPASSTYQIQIADAVYSDPGVGLTGSRTISTDGIVASYATDAAQPSVSTDIAAVDSDATFGKSAASLTYYYVVSNATGIVPVDVVYDLKTSASNGGSSLAYVQVLQLSNLNNIYEDNLFQYSPLDASAHDERASTYVSLSEVGDTFAVTLSASGTMGSNGTSASAFADPHIFIDPTYLAVNPGATLELSAGIGNVGPVPEPASWALMAAGLGLVGFRRAKRTRSA